MLVTLLPHYEECRVSSPGSPAVMAGPTNSARGHQGSPEIDAAWGCRVQGPGQSRSRCLSRVKKSALCPQLHAGEGCSSGQENSPTVFSNSPILITAR